MTDPMDIEPKEMAALFRALTKQESLLDHLRSVVKSYAVAAKTIERQAAEVAALKADREKLVRAVVERCAEVADEEKISAQQMRDAARKEKDGQGALFHAAEASAAFCIASAIRSLNIDDLVKEAGE